MLAPKRLAKQWRRLIASSSMHATRGSGILGMLNGPPPSNSTSDSSEWPLNSLEKTSSGTQNLQVLFPSDCEPSSGRG